MTGKKWLVVAAVAVVVIVVGGYVAIRAVEGGSTSKLTLPAVTSTTSDSSAPTGSAGSTSSSADPTSSDLSGTWKVSSGSTAGYRVQETLFGVSNTAVGRTSAVTGTFTISGMAVSAGSFTVELTKVTSDRSQRDEQFQGRIMDTADFPTATFKLTQPIQLANLTKVSTSATGDLTLHGVTKSVTTSQLNAQVNGSKVQVQGEIPIRFSDWNIDNPSGGPATTGDTGILEFLLNFDRS